MKYPCKECGNYFEPKNWNQIYCCKTCRCKQQLDLERDKADLLTKEYKQNPDQFMKDRLDKVIICPNCQGYKENYKNNYCFRCYQQLFIIDKRIDGKIVRIECKTKEEKIKKCERIKCEKEKIKKENYWNKHDNNTLAGYQREKIVNKCVEKWKQLQTEKRPEISDQLKKELKELREELERT